MNYEDRVTKEYIESAIAGKCEVVSGTYVGDGEDTRRIRLGFTPKAVLLFTNTGYTGDYELLASRSGGLALPNCPIRVTFDNVEYTILAIVDGGFQIVCQKYLGNYSRYLAATNVSGTIYYYLAIR